MWRASYPSIFRNLSQHAVPGPLPPAFSPPLSVCNLFSFTRNHLTHLHSNFLALLFPTIFTPFFSLIIFCLLLGGTRKKMSLGPCRWLSSWALGPRPSAVVQTHPSLSVAKTVTGTPPPTNLIYPCTRAIPIPNRTVQPLGPPKLHNSTCGQIAHNTPSSFCSFFWEAVWSRP